MKQEWNVFTLKIRKRTGVDGEQRDTLTCMSARKHSVSGGTIYWCNKHYNQVCSKHWKEHESNHTIENLAK